MRRISSRMMRRKQSSSITTSAAVVAAVALVTALSMLPTTTSTYSSSDNTLLGQPFHESFTKLDHAPCVTLYHRNGRVGCGTADRSVQIGSLRYFDGNLPNEAHPFVAVVEDYLLTAQSVSTLQGASANGLLKGILVLNSTSSSSSSSSGGSSSGGGSSSSGSGNEYSFHSLDAQTPQGYGTPSVGVQYGNYYYKWNANGEGLFYYDLYGIAMAFVKDSDVSESLRQEAVAASSKDEEGDESKNPNGDVDIVAEFNYYMGPDDIKSEDCLSWKDVATGEWSPKCLPIGGTSVWAYAGPPPGAKYYRHRSRRNERELGNNNNNNNGNNNGYYGNGNNNGYYGNGNNNNNNGNSNVRQVIMIAAGMDSTSMFHDLSPGANTAASNILTVMMAAKLLGGSVDHQTLGNLPKRIVFGLFAAESYGFVGSRSFFRDVAWPGFKCQDKPVRSVSRNDKSEYGCLYPLRHSLEFANLGGNIAGLISVDQVAHAVAEDVLYVHADQNNDYQGAFLANCLQGVGTNYFSVAYSSTQAGDNYGYPYPPTPLTSLLALSGGSAGGAVLTGYDYAFTNRVPYHSRTDSAVQQNINYNSIAAAATIIARGALAAAYDGGDYDYDTAAQYAVNAVPELSSDDETMLELANCLFYDGNCDLMKKYSATETANERIRTGINVQGGVSLGTPPNYYAGVYQGYYGQPFVQVGDDIFGAYDGKQYGERKTDAIAMNPSQLSETLFGMFNHFLGQIGQEDGGDNNDGQQQQQVQCKKSSDCADVEYCYKPATCTGAGVCVCQHAHYHQALDEALYAAPGYPTGYFQILSADDGEDAGVSAMYTEPYWSSDVGVRVYRDAGKLPGFLALVAGAAAAGLSAFAAFVLRVGLKKEKLY